MLHNLKWRLAKLGWRLITWWANNQHRIDGDWEQVSEIVEDWMDTFWLDEN